MLLRTLNRQVQLMQQRSECCGEVVCVSHWMRRLCEGAQEFAAAHERQCSNTLPLTRSDDEQSDDLSSWRGLARSADGCLSVVWAGVLRDIARCKDQWLYRLEHWSMKR